MNKRTFPVPGTDTIMKSRFSINKCIGYVATNNVPEKCEIRIDRRYTPGEKIEDVQKEIQDVLDKFVADDPEYNVTVNYVMGNPVSYSPPDSDLVKAIQKAAKSVVGFTPKPQGGSHSSDHGWFVKQYAKPIASYGIGGTGSHGANERIAVEDVILSTKVYALTIMNIMGVA